MADRGFRTVGKRNNTLNISDQKVYEAIRKRAYELYLQRQGGSTQGNDKTDWFEAEKQIKRELGMTTR